MNHEEELVKNLEKILKINTTGFDKSRSDTYRYPYEPTPYCVLERLANSGYITKKNTLIDYGCGKGRVDFYLSYQTKCKSIGIEYDDRIYERAMDNRENTVVKNRVEFVMTDATTYRIPKEVDRLYFFNPFSLELLKSVMERVMESYYENPREMILMFYFPSDEYVSYLTCETELDFLDEIECDDLFEENKSRERILMFGIGK